MLTREKKIAMARERYYYLSDGEVNEYNIRIMRLKFNIINNNKKKIKNKNQDNYYDGDDLLKRHKFVDWRRPPRDVRCTV